MRLCRTTGICLGIFTAALLILTASESKAFFGRRPVPSPVYMTNFGTPVVADGSDLMITPFRGASPFRYRFWQQKGASPYVESSMNVSYNDEYTGCDPCGAACNPCDMACVDCCYPCFDFCCDPCFDSCVVPRRCPILGGLKNLLFGRFCRVRRGCYDPCWPICWDPCVSCCDPCGWSPCGGCDMGIGGSCCGADDMPGETVPVESGSEQNSNGGIEATPVSPTPIKTEEADPAVPSTGSGVINMIVPSDSVVYINGYQTKLSGTERNFVANNLVEGQVYAFEIRVVAERNGQMVEETQTTNLVAGANSSLAFEFKNTNPMEAVALR